MRVKDDVVDIMVFEEIVPDISAVLESMMEHEEKVWVLATHQSSNVAIEQLQCPHVAVCPWLVDWLHSIYSWMMAPLIEQPIDGINCPIKVLEINVIITSTVPWSHPFASLEAPVLKVIIIEPNGFVC